MVHPFPLILHQASCIWTDLCCTVLTVSPVDNPHSLSCSSCRGCVLCLLNLSSPLSSSRAAAETVKNAPWLVPLAPLVLTSSSLIQSSYDLGHSEAFHSVILPLYMSLNHSLQSRQHFSLNSQCSFLQHTHSQSSDDMVGMKIPPCFAAQGMALPGWGPTAALEVVFPWVNFSAKQSSSLLQNHHGVLAAVGSLNSYKWQCPVVVLPQSACKAF